MQKNESSLVKVIDSLADPDIAFDAVKRLLEDNTQDGTRISRHHKGQKRHPGYKKMLIRPLDGVSNEVSRKIRMVTALRYGEIPDSQIERALGLHNRWIWKYETKYPEAFLQAKEDVVKAAVSEYHDNVAFARCAISDIGMKAIETLSDIMDDTSAPAGMRLKAATEALKMTFLGPPKEQSVAEGVIDRMGDALSKIVTASKRGDNYIYDAEITSE